MLRSAIQLSDTTGLSVHSFACSGPKEAINGKEMALAENLIRKPSK